MASLQKGKEADIAPRKINQLEDMDSLQNPDNTALVLQRDKVEFAAGDWQKYFCPIDEWHGLRAD